MFKKLVSNLPFSPSLINQIGFYSDRLRKEKSIRRMSFVFMALAVAVQSLAVISPPERSLALSSNHIISGVKNKQDVINAWKNDPTVSKIYGKFGVTLKDIENMSGTPYTTVSTRTGKDYWSIGRNSLTSYTNVNDIYKNQQIKLEYDKNSYFYMRPLKAWDINNPYNSYKAFKGVISATGQTFWILEDCGNLTTIGKYTPPPAPTPAPTPKPVLDIKKSIVNHPDYLKPGDSFTYAIEYRNKGKDSVAQNVTIEDQLDIKKYAVVSPANLNINGSGYLVHEVGNLQKSDTYKKLLITLRLKSPLSTPDETCNTATIKATNASNVTSKKVCVGIINPCPYDTDIDDVNNPECVEPKVVCKLIDAAINLTTRKITYATKVSTTNNKLVKIKSYNYNFGDNTELEIPSNELSNSTSHTYRPGEYTAYVTVKFVAPKADGQTEQSTDCSQPVKFDEDQPLGQSKTVANLTQDLEDTDTLSRKVSPGDVLEYKLATLNSQNYDRINIEIEDYIGDILDYAELDIEHLKSSGGKYDKDTKKIVWEGIKIPANSEVESVFRVQILDPVPSTNSPSGVSTDYDCRISNEYGNELTLEVQCPLVKGLETLPNTGPGTSMIAVTLLTTVIGYLFARARLLNKEINLIRTDYATTGGM